MRGSRGGRTFFSTFEDTLGKGIGLSDSPTSVQGKEEGTRVSTLPSFLGTANPAATQRFGEELTLDHVLDENGADGDIAVDGEGLVVGAVVGEKGGRGGARGWAGRGGRRFRVVGRENEGHRQQELDQPLRRELT